MMNETYSVSTDIIRPRGIEAQGHSLRAQSYGAPACSPKRPKGWRKPIGHRTPWLDERRFADACWEKWLAAASLRPDLQRPATQSLPLEARPKTRRRKLLVASELAAGCAGRHLRYPP